MYALIDVVLKDFLRVHSCPFSGFVVMTVDMSKLWLCLKNKVSEAF